MRKCKSMNIDLLSLTAPLIGWVYMKQMLLHMYVKYLQTIRYFHKISISTVMKFMSPFTVRGFQAAILNGS